MNKSFSNDQSTSELSLEQLLLELWHAKSLIAISMLIGLLTCLLYSINLSNIYKSEALLAPVQKSSQINGYLQGISGIAGLTGVGTMAQTGDNPTSEAIEKVKSLSFFKEQIMPNIFLPDLLAADFWDSKSSKLFYKKNIYSENKWINGKGGQPTAQESFKKFREQMRINQDSSTGFVKITIEHQSPVVAQQWTEILVEQLNMLQRSNAKLEAEAAIDYLNFQMSKTNYAEIKLALSELIKNEIQKLTLIEAKKEYVFKYIDPPVVEEQKIKPKRTLLTIMGALVGALLGVLFVFIRNYFKTNKSFFNLGNRS